MHSSALFWYQKKSVFLEENRRFTMASNSESFLEYRKHQLLRSTELPKMAFFFVIGNFQVASVDTEEGVIYNVNSIGFRFERLDNSSRWPKKKHVFLYN